MAEGHNAGVLQSIKDQHAAATQPDLHVSPTVTEPVVPFRNETPVAASTAPIDTDPPAVVPPVAEPVAKAPSGRRGQAAAQ